LLIATATRNEKQYYQQQPSSSSFRMLSSGHYNIVSLSMRLLLLCVVFQFHSSYCWLSTKSSSNNHRISTTTATKRAIRMDTEGPPSGSTAIPQIPVSLKGKWDRHVHASVGTATANRRRRPGNQKSPTTSVPPLTSQCRLPWLQEDTPAQRLNGDDCRNIFFSHWNWQLEYFQKHLTNVQVNTCHDDDESSLSNLLYVKTTKPSHSNHDISDDAPEQQQQQQIYTISLQSDEYRDIRMTYLHFGKHAQIFRCTCYPRSDMPILGMGMMQFAGGQRNVAILDFQPLLSSHGENEEVDDGINNESMERQSEYISKLLEIRSSYPSFQQPMSNRHFDPNEQRYFTANPFIGKWSETARNDQDDGINNTDRKDGTLLWQELQTIHQECVQTHVEMTQATRQDCQHNEEQHQRILRLHSEYDTFVAAKEPASQLLGSAFGKDVAHQLVHQVIFPLSSRKSE